MLQLTLFDISEKRYLVSYWAYPIDKSGNYIKNVMQKYEEEKPGSKLKDFLHMLEVVNYKNIKAVAL